ncbi:GGDEF domain-containing protein [Psychromonas sp.]|uniref:GGDEF domain-containing protein n=1 Tax=Psychromonas sp. TaxID=1884585 RepID=UPI00356AC8DC
MKHLYQYLRAVCALFLIQSSHSASAFELIDVVVPEILRNAFEARNSAPRLCIAETTLYINAHYNNTTVTNNLQNGNELPLQLQAYCYAQLGEYHKALELLQSILQKPIGNNDKIETLNILALAIPKEDRPQLSNFLLISLLNDSIEDVQPPLMTSNNLTITRLLTLSKLYLEEDHYQDAHSAQAKAKQALKNNTNIKLHAWSSYYEGLYFDHIKQEQLASLHFLTADKLADKHGFIKLSGQVKNSIATMYQKKYRFSRALDYSSQRIELYMGTEHTVKQVQSITQFAVLKRQNNEHNQALIYLFNALELIEENSHGGLLGITYLEIGRTYAEKGSNENNKADLELAQKYLQNARFHFNRLDKVSLQIESLLLLAKLNLFNEDPGLAILQLEKILQLAGQNDPALRAQAHEMLALSYEITGSPQLAILHFKNFHSLQNKIKENSFKLQQLQISEQLQLLEQAQQQNRLESQNTELQKTTILYKTLTYTSITLFVLSTIILLSTSKRYRKLSAIEKKTQQQLSFHARSKLPTQGNTINNFNAIYCGKPLFYALVKVPFLSELNELRGALPSEKLEEKLGEALKSYFSDDINLFHIRDNQILFISEQTAFYNAAGLAHQIEQFFADFAALHHLPGAISIGIVAYPFLSNASRAISPAQTLNLNSLALFAASQIRRSKQESSWVELYAIDNLQPAFFDGDLWQLGQIAIDKGLVKIQSSHRNFLFTWPELDNAGQNDDLYPQTT